jgi:predicted enzyme related to lactoylglutathione lyase
MHRPVINARKRQRYFELGRPRLSLSTSRQPAGRMPFSNGAVSTAPDSVGQTKARGAAIGRSRRAGLFMSGMMWLMSESVRVPQPMRLELLTVPVADVDRAKAFYADQVGFVVEQDRQVDENHRFVELAPPGSACSIALTKGYADPGPGSLRGTQLKVDDLDAVRAVLLRRSVEASEV